MSIAKIVDHEPKHRASHGVGGNKPFSLASRLNVPQVEAATFYIECAAVRSRERLSRFHSNFIARAEGQKDAVLNAGHGLDSGAGYTITLGTFAVLFGFPIASGRPNSDGLSS